MGTKTLLTVEQFEQLPEQPGVRYELDHGELIEVSCPTYQHNQIRGRMEFALRAFLAGQAVGEVVAEQEFRIAEGTVRRPDVAYIRAEFALRIDHSKSILEVVPDLIVEVVSPNDNASDLMHKVNQFLSAGCQCVWVVYPVEREVLAHGPNDEVRVYSEGKNLEAPALLPGFTLPVNRIFE